MKIIIKKKIPTSISLDPKHKPKYKTIAEVVEIPDELVNKTIAVIDELLDRTYDDWEERSWTGVDFPLVPFPFFDKNRLPENVGIDDYWISCWLNTDLYNIIKERTKIIDMLNDLGAMEEIKHHPVINISAGIFKGEEFDLVIDRDRLIALRKLIIEKQKKSTEKQKGTIISPIRKTALQNIAVEIKELTSHSGLNDFFGDFDIPKELYLLEGSKHDKVFSVLSALSNVDQETLFRVIEEAVHPLRFFGGDEERALQMQDLFSSFLQFDGYCIHNGKIVKATPKLLKEIKARIEKRKTQTNQITKSKGIVPIKEPFPIRIVGETEIKGLEKRLEAIAKTKREEKKKKQVKGNILCLNKAGDLYKEPKERFCYPMSESEGRHKIVRYFVENKIYDYYPTRELSTALEKDEISLMKEIGKINSIIQTKLKIKDKILDGKRGSGYRINPKYKIILKNE